MFLTVNKNTTKICKVTSNPAIFEPRTHNYRPNQSIIKDLTLSIQQINYASWIRNHKEYFAEDEVKKIENVPTNAVQFLATEA
jgi:hypothetical protein